MRQQRHPGGAFEPAESTKVLGVDFEGTEGRERLLQSLWDVLQSNGAGSAAIWE